MMFHSNSIILSIPYGPTQLCGWNSLRPEELLATPPTSVTDDMRANWRMPASARVAWLSIVSLMHADCGAEPLALSLYMAGTTFISLRIEFGWKECSLERKFLYGHIYAWTRFTSSWGMQTAFLFVFFFWKPSPFYFIFLAFQIHVVDLDHICHASFTTQISCTRLVSEALFTVPRYINQINFLKGCDYYYYMQVHYSGGQRF
jgi:hypothetical protein